MTLVCANQLSSVAILCYAMRSIYNPPKANLPEREFLLDPQNM
jgi:hypothetical protein